MTDTVSVRRLRISRQMPSQVRRLVTSHPSPPLPVQSQACLGIIRTKCPEPRTRLLHAMVVVHALTFVAVPVQSDEIVPSVEIVRPLGRHTIVPIATAA